MSDALSGNNSKPSTREGPQYQVTSIPDCCTPDLLANPPRDFAKYNISDVVPSGTSSSSPSPSASTSSCHAVQPPEVEHLLKQSLNPASMLRLLHGPESGAASYGFSSFMPRGSLKQQQKDAEQQEAKARNIISAAVNTKAGTSKIEPATADELTHIVSSKPAPSLSLSRPSSVSKLRWIPRSPKIWKPTTTYEQQRSQGTIMTVDTASLDNIDNGCSDSIKVIKLGHPKFWSRKEQNMFEQGARQFGRNFGAIQRRFLPHRPVPHVVEFYYSHWKYSARYRRWKRAIALEKEKTLAKQTAYFHASREDVREDAKSDNPIYEDHNESFCSVCQEGGSLICCEGLCNRAFHTHCLGVKSADDLPDEWKCDSCSRGRHACWVCSKEGEVNVDVFCCSLSCGKFYHLDCVYKSSRTLSVKQWFNTSFDVPVDESRRHQMASRNSKKSDETSLEIFSKQFVCPYHSCAGCALRLDTKPPTPFLRCGFCSKSFHRDCFVKLLKEMPIDPKTSSSSVDKVASNATQEVRGPVHIVKLSDDSTICCQSCEHKLTSQKRERNSAGLTVSLALTLDASPVKRPRHDPLENVANNASSIELGEFKLDSALNTSSQATSLIEKNEKNDQSNSSAATEGAQPSTPTKVKQSSSPPSKSSSCVAVPDLIVSAIPSSTISSSACSVNMSPTRLKRSV